jgi:hypothetical protein
MVYITLIDRAGRDARFFVETRSEVLLELTLG